MGPPIITTTSKLQKILRLIAFAYFLWQLRKFIRKLRALSDSKHLHQRYRNPLAQPSKRLFPQFFESKQNGLWIFHRDWVIPKPKGVIIISHGLAEHIQRYEHF
eukprot:49109_1